MLEQISSLVAALPLYGGLGVFLASTLEEIIAPIPSSLVMMAAGFLLIPSQLPWPQALLLGSLRVLLPIASGVTLGALFIYALGFWGGKPLILALRRLTGLHWHEVERLTGRFTRGARDELTLLILRALPIVPNTAISAFWGVLRLSLPKFLIFTFLGSLVRAAIMAALGWTLGGAYRYYSPYFERAENAVLLLAGLTLLGFLFWLSRRRYR